MSETLIRLTKGGRTMKRNIIVAMVCVMLLSIMPVMAGGSNESSSSSDGKTVVRILTRFSNPGNPREKYFQDMVAKFNEENPCFYIFNLMNI